MAINHLERKRRLYQGATRHQTNQMPHRAIWTSYAHRRLQSRWPNALLHQPSLRSQVSPTPTKALWCTWSHSLHAQLLHNIVLLFPPSNRGAEPLYALAEAYSSVLDALLVPPNSINKAIQHRLRQHHSMKSRVVASGVYILAYALFTSYP